MNKKDLRKTIRTIFREPREVSEAHLRTLDEADLREVVDLLALLIEVYRGGRR